MKYGLSLIISFILPSYLIEFLRFLFHMFSFFILCYYFSRFCFIFHIISFTFYLYISDYFSYFLHISHKLFHSFFARYKTTPDRQAFVLFTFIPQVSNCFQNSFDYCVIVSVLRVQQVRDRWRIRVTMIFHIFFRYLLM